MSVDDFEATPTLVETAQRIEKHRRHSEARIILVIVLAQTLIGLLVGLWVLYELHGLIDGIRKQNAQQLVAIEQGQKADESDAAAQAEILMRQQRILDRLGEKVSTGADVKRLEEQVRFLRREGRKLRDSINRLIGILEGVGVASNGGG